MRKRIALPVLSVAAVIASLLVAPTPALAHGYVSSPPSRQAFCAQNRLQCGNIRYEPQSVEGPKNQRSCHGGNAAFAELNDDSKPWPVTGIGSTTTFTWVFTARHVTSNWEYYIGNSRIASFSGNMQQPPASVSHTLNLGGYSGRQKILAVWNIGDTTNAFYACVDVNIGGGSTPPPGGGGGSCGSPQWSASQVYVGGNTVTHNGRTWRARWWTQGETPGSAEVWADQGACSSGVATSRLAVASVG